MSVCPLDVKQNTKHPEEGMDEPIGELTRSGPNQPMDIKYSMLKFVMLNTSATHGSHQDLAHRVHDVSFSLSPFSAFPPMPKHHV